MDSTVMASSPSSSGGRGRRKQAKPQRKQVDVDNLSTDESVLTSSVTTTGIEITMSPDNNHNDQHPSNNYVIDIASKEHRPSLPSSPFNGQQRTSLVPETMTNDNIKEMTDVGDTKLMESDERRDRRLHVQSESSTPVGGQRDEDEKIQEYLQRSDTAVIFPEPVDQSANVPSLANGLGKDGEDMTAGAEYFIKCQRCQKGCPSFQAFKEHMEAMHPQTAAEDGKTTPLPPPSTTTGSPSPSLLGTGGPYSCSQCTESFNTKDQLEKHELLHFPNGGQVSCKVCHKTFANVYRLQRHMISHDESALLRKFKCTQCEKAFKFKHHLKEHIRIHSGEKPFECANCGKRFSHSGSYSSHMTSKKCLVMNLKMGRTRAPSVSSVLDKSQNQINRTPRRPLTSGPSLNNNVTTSPNHNSFLPILPKYTEAAAAAIISAMGPRDGSYQPQPTSAPPLHPFYLPAMHLNGAAINSYTMPSIGQLLEQFHSNSPHKPAPVTNESVKEELKQVPECKKEELEDDYIEETNEVNKSSSSGDLVMDVEDDDEEKCHLEKNKPPETGRISPGDGSNSGDLEAVKRILETVNATVTKQLLQANMQKITSSPSPTAQSPTIKSFEQTSVDDCSRVCPACQKSFSSNKDFNQHECVTSEQTDVKSEGLAAKLEEAVTVKTDDGSVNGGCSGSEEDLDEYQNSKSRPTDDYELDGDSATTGDHLSEDGRKVRVRSLIADEQLAVLKEHYLINPRPKREELARIADKIGFPVRVVQVWFQNTRARDRREGRLVHIPYSPLPPATCFPSNGTSSSASMPLQPIPYRPGSPQYMMNLEQPLDLSTKKNTQSTATSPSSSPHRPTSATAHSESGEEAVNLSQKSSRSPTPYRQTSFQPMHYQNSNCSSDFHRSPSPGPHETIGNGSRLARILAQPVSKYVMAGMSNAMGLLPMERLLHYSPEINVARSPLLNTASLSPGSERQSWKMEETEDSAVSQEVEQIDDETSSKRVKMSQMALKNLGNSIIPAGPGSEPEAEGQFICDQCDKAFSKQSSLARHKYEHSGQRPHKCDECPKAFKHKHHLTEHKRLHSGEKPFQCCKCLKRFSHSGSYSQHMNHRYSYCKPYRE